MSATSLKLTLAGLTLAASALSAQSAHAHINMEGLLKARGGDMKTAPCGNAKRGGGEIYTFEPGATIKLGVAETVAHDGYFRIAFDDDGDDDFKDPASIDPINPNRYGTNKKCLGDATDHCGKSDFCNVVSNEGGPTVLWDNLDPHMPVPFVGGKSWTWTVTLPNVECDNCTLQVMQVMEDPAGGAHGPFDGDADLYYRCVDIVLKKGAGNTPGTTTDAAKNEGMACISPTEPVDPETRGDAGVSEQPDGPSDERDAGTASDDADGDDVADDAPTGSSNTGKKDAGKTTVKKDAGSSGNDNTDDEESTTTSDDGCSVASKSEGVAGAAWSVLALGALLVRRRRAVRTRG